MPQFLGGGNLEGMEGGGEAAGGGRIAGQEVGHEQRKPLDGRAMELGVGKDFEKPGENRIVERDGGRKGDLGHGRRRSLVANTTRGACSFPRKSSKFGSLNDLIPAVGEMSSA